jgi:ABC-type phosphate transport system substrate-binding protein
MLLGKMTIRRMAFVMLVVGFCFSRGVRAAELFSQNRNKPGQSLAIVVNHANPIENLSSAELRRIFLGRKARWPNGRRVAVAMLDSQYPERSSALRQIYHMDETAYEEYFIKATFRGEVFVAPKTLASPDLMRKFVFNAPGAIGYLRTSDLDDTVKVVKIDGLLPNEKDYSLQIDEPVGE